MTRYFTYTKNTEVQKQFSTLVTHPAVIPFSELLGRFSRADEPAATSGHPVISRIRSRLRVT